VFEGAAEGMEVMAQWCRFYNESPHLRLGLVGEDAIAAKQAGQIAMYMGWQNIAPLEGRLDLLDAFYHLGLRIVQPTYQYRNLAGDGCGERVQSGLSKFGVDLVLRCNKLGIGLDVSHVSDATSLEIVATSDQPVMATHVGVRSIAKGVRNKDDALIRAIAAKGGVICIAGKSGFLSEKGLTEGTTIDNYVDHMKYVCDLVGSDHVGIGTDVSDDRRYNRAFLEDFHRRFPEIAIIDDKLDGSLMHPDGLKNPSEIPNITAALQRRGFSDEDVKKLVGGNVQRVVTQVLKPRP